MNKSRSKPFTPSRELLRIKRGPIDGPKFFSRSPLRSGYFLTASLILLASELLDLLLIYQYWRRFSGFEVGVIVMVGYGFAIAWIRAYQYINRVRDLYFGGALEEVELGSPLDIALGVAAGAINNILFYSFASEILLLAYTRSLLSRGLVK